jgi:hypothetical protein
LDVKILNKISFWAEFKHLHNKNIPLAVLKPTGKEFW